MRSTLPPTNDLVFKLLFARPGSERALMNLLTDVLRPTSPIATVEVLNPAVEPETVREKAIVLDLLVRLADGTRVNVEMQAVQLPGFADRMLLYWARVYAAQAVRGASYEDLAPTISILFTCFAAAGEDRLHAVYRLVSERGRVFSDKLRLDVISLPLRSSALGEGDERLLAWASFLGATTDEEVEEALMRNPNVEPAAEALVRLSADEEAQRLAEERERALLGWRVTMGAARREGRDEGRAEGRAEASRVLLLRLATRKFGPIPAPLLARIEAATEAEVSRWFDGVLDATDLEVLLAADHA